LDVQPSLQIIEGRFGIGLPDTDALVRG
jgi:hypothetical protein